MARDAALLDNLDRTGVAARIYSWDGPWISLGMFQKPERDLKSGCPVPYVMRPTGGRAVLHGHDVTVGLAIALEHISERKDPQQVARSVRAVYRRATQPLIAALRECGVDACLGEVLKGSMPSPKSADCFAHIGANDVIDRKRLTKVCGIAMRLTGAAVLIQASIPVGQPLCEPSLVFDAPWSGLAAHIAPELLRNALERNLVAFSACQAT